jgi:hypothetical protein
VGISVEELGDIVSTYLPKAIDTYALGDWHFSVFLYADSAPGGGVGAHVRCQFPYQKATIDFYAEDLNTTEDAIDAIYHELEHVLHAPFDTFSDIVNRQLPPKAVLVANEAWCVAAEQCRLMIRRAMLANKTIGVPRTEACGGYVIHIEAGDTTDE